MQSELDQEFNSPEAACGAVYSGTPIRSLARISRPKLFVCNSLQPLRQIQKSYLRQNQQFAASFAKHPGGVGLRGAVVAIVKRAGKDAHK